MRSLTGSGCWRPPMTRSTSARFLERTGRAGASPFSAARMDTLARLSAALLADRVLRQDPASVAVAYWLRRGQLARLADEQARRAAAEPDVVRVPVGRVLHLAPSNVDTLFIYSWALAYLCGNASVVRLSQEPVSSSGAAPGDRLGGLGGLGAAGFEPVPDLRAR